MRAVPASRVIRLPTTGIDCHLLEWDAQADGDSDHTVVLIHGFLDFAWTWEGMMHAGLSGRFHAVAPDLRGHGDSARVGTGGYYHFPDYLADLRDLIAAVARKRVSLVGHSMGGAVAAYYAGTYPAEIHKLALLEGLGPPETEGLGPTRVAAWIAAWERARKRPPRLYASVDEAAAQLRKHDPRLAAELARELAARGTAPADGKLRFKHDPLHTTSGPFGFTLANAERFWRRITCPVLMVEGSDSILRHAPQETARRAACFANRTSVILPEAGHMMQRHQPAALAQRLSQFLAD
jgi:pimeloyl-ACP methyl ester carboxylesterase